MDGTSIAAMMIAVGIVLLFFWALARVFKSVFFGGQEQGVGMFCTQCGHEGGYVDHTKGSMIIEIFLWLCFIVPGLIYSLWRVSSRVKVCPMCEGERLIPANSPMARKLRGDAS